MRRLQRVSRSLVVATLLSNSTCVVDASSATKTSSPRPLTLSSPETTLCAYQCAVRCFNLRQQKIEERRLRELERAGIDPNDDTPWLAPEEIQRLSEEEEQKKAEQAEALKKLMEERSKQDVLRRQKMKEFRAKQIAANRQRKVEASSSSEHGGGVDVGAKSRVIEEVGDEKGEEIADATTTTTSKPTK